MARTTPLPPLVLISDASRIGEARFFDVLRSALAAGLPALQLREPNWSFERLRDFARRAQEEVGQRAAILINRSTDLAVSLGLDGVHVGGGDPQRVAVARRLLGDQLLIGYSAHNVRELTQAHDAGADYCYLSPVFAPLSKPATLQTIGLTGFRRACENAPLPVYALGGIRPVHAAALRDGGACGVAVIGSLLDAPDPEEMTRQFLAAW